jgi:hypothetical protein
MDHVEALEHQLASPITQAAHTDLATRHGHRVCSLLAHRDDLRGVSAFADIVEESVRWSA